MGAPAGERKEQESEEKTQPLPTVPLLPKFDFAAAEKKEDRESNAKSVFEMALMMAPPIFD